MTVFSFRPPLSHALTLQEIPSVGPERVGLDGWLSMSLPTLLAALLLAVATVIGLRLASYWIERALARARVDKGTRILVHRVASIGILVLGMLLILGVFGIPPATLITLVGAVGLAFGLAVQDILKNFFSGIYLLVERPFRVGDVIRVKDQQGAVEHIGVRTTMLRTTDNVHILVPNAIIFAEVVSNHTYQQPSAPGAVLEATPSRASAATPSEADRASALADEAALPRLDGASGFGSAEREAATAPPPRGE
jgi:small-conductance mechanosensitive channel